MAVSQAKKRPNNFVNLQTLPPSVLFITIACSWVGMIAAIILSYPLWVVGLVTILPWVPVLFTESLWKYKHYKWFAIFGVTMLVQCLHFIEHIAQIVQVDVIGRPRLLSTGILGGLDLEPVHFVFDTTLLVLTTILLFGKFRNNIPLWIAWVVAIWHTTEHWYITYFWAFDPKNYDPNNPTGLKAREGLLGMDGVLWPSSPFPRIELHFIYNLLYTVPLVIAFIVVIRQAYDEYLKKAFPRLSETQLAGLNNSIETVHVAAGNFVIRQGEAADRFYIISSGEVEILQGAGSQLTVVNRLTKGQFFGEVGLLTGSPRNASVRAVTSCELLALDRDTFRAVIGNSAPSAQDFAQVIAQRSSAGMAAVAVGAPVAAGVVGSGPPLLPTGYAGAAPQSGPGYHLPGSPPSGPAFSPVSGLPAPPVSNPGFAPLAQGAPGQGIEGPTAPAFNAPGATPPADPHLVQTVVSRGPAIFRDAASGWAYGLVFTSGQLQGQGVVLSAERMTIGRDVGNEIRITDDAQVSRRHAELLRSATGEFQLRDLRSSNGVFVNGERLVAEQPRLLQENDEVKIGNATFAVRKVGTRVV